MPGIHRSKNIGISGRLRPRLSLRRTAVTVVTTLLMNGCLVASTQSDGARVSAAPPSASVPASVPAPASASASQAIEFAHFSQELMSTYIEVAVPAGPSAQADADAVFEVFREVERTANEWKDPSPLAAVNHAAGGDAVAIPPSLMALLIRGQKAGALTEGAFDITWAALWGLWDFNAAHPRVPAVAEVQKRLPLIDYRRVELDASAGTARLPVAGMKIGLGGIAKGYALEKGAEALRHRGVTHFLLSAGGQIAAGGSKRVADTAAETAPEPWRVGIRDPRGTPDDFFAIVPVSDMSLSTSGDYERYFEQDGVRYHHILDPRTGMPARGLRSATVIGPDPTLVDALSTAMMVLGTEKALTLAAQLPGVEAVLVDDQGGLHLTAGLKDRLKLIHAPLP